MLRRVLLTVVALVGAAILALASWPQLFGLHRVMPWAEFSAMRGLLAACALGGALLLVIAAIASRRLRAAAIGLALLFVGILVLNVLVLSLRGFGTDGAAWAAEKPGELTVLGWNTLGGTVSPEAVAELALSEGADVLALAETHRGDAEAIAELLGAAGSPMQLFVEAFDDADPQQSTALLVSEQLGDYRHDPGPGSTPGLPSVVARPLSGDGPTVIAAHPVPPLPSMMADWEAGLAWLAERCRDGEAIVAGDLNATLDHFAGLGDPGFELGQCRDAARAAGAGAVGTWPSALPELLGAPIDHVLATREWETVAVRIADPVGSDHRPILARLRLA